MLFTPFLASLVSLVATALASCAQDNCYRALQHYQSTSAGFCNSYLATSTKVAPSPIATCGPSRISSACSCLTTSAPVPTTTPKPTTAPTPTTVNTATCARQSTTACPVSYNPCCAYVCAEAQVPFLVCSPENQTFLAQCQQCPTATATSNPTTSTTKPVTTTTTTKPTLTTITTKPTPTTINTATCARQSTTACPVTPDPCCAYVCAEAQVPFLVCSPENQTFLAQCQQCATTVPTLPATTMKPVTTTTTKPATTTTVNTATCVRSSAAACPTKYDPCCAFLCAEAQVPFAVCSTENETVLAQCQSCAVATGL